MDVVPFGVIDANNLEEYYDSEMTVNGRTVLVDVNFESSTIDESALQALSLFLGRLDSLEKEAFSAISYDWDLGDDSEAAREYLEFHLDNIDTAEEMQAFFGVPDENLIDKAVFMKSLKLYRIGFYPEDDDYYAVFDIQFSPNHTNHLIDCVFNRQGTLYHIGIES